MASKDLAVQIGADITDLINTYGKDPSLFTGGFTDYFKSLPITGFRSHECADGTCGGKEI
jgi:hypothetical protein